MELTQSQIESINSNCPEDQGIFKQPFGIPVHIKEHVIYCRYECGGKSGGNYHGDASVPYSKSKPKDYMKVLDLVLKELRPQISFLEYRQIEPLIHDNTETKFEYYGNSTEWKIEYIKLSELYKLISEF